MTFKTIPTGTFFDEDGDEFYLEASISGYYHVYKVNGGYVGPLVKSNDGWALHYSL